MVGTGEASSHRSESPKKRTPSEKRKHKAKLYSFNVREILSYARYIQLEGDDL